MASECAQEFNETQDTSQECFVCSKFTLLPISCIQHLEEEFCCSFPTDPRNCAAVEMVILIGSDFLIKVLYSI